MPTRKMQFERLRGIDQMLSTRDIERITNRHRCTIYRWVRAGTFPGKRAGGGRGWLQSDVERWLQVGPGDPPDGTNGSPGAHQQEVTITDCRDSRQLRRQKPVARRFPTTLGQR